MKSGIMLIQ